MKKSKLLIPAVGFLMISLAAAGTSTVAWFTSTTAATATLGNIVAAKVDGGLKIYAANDAKVDHDSDNATTAIEAYGITDTTPNIAADATTSLGFTIQSKGYLRDSSLKLTNSAGTTTVADYIPKDYNSTGAPTSFEITTHSVDNSSFYMKTGSGATEKDIYTYAKFTINYVSQAADNQAVYFNFKDSKLGQGTSFATTTGAIEKALRIGFVSSDTAAPSYTTPTIFAPANDSDLLAASTGLDYVTGTATTDTAKYSKTQAVNLSCLTETALATYPSYTSFAEDDTNYHTSLSYLGTAKQGTSFKVTYYVWFDGLDATCIDTNNLTDGISQVFQGSFKFFSVKKA